jgi:hypothetical protein
MKEWLASKWKWLTGALAVLLVAATAFLVGRRRKTGEIDLAVAQHELERAVGDGKKAEAKVFELSVKQREIAEDILREKTRRAGLETEWESLDAEEVRRRLRDLGLLK